MDYEKYSSETMEATYRNGSPRADRSVADLLKGLVGNVQDIIRSEVKLARAEIGEEVSKASSAGRSFGLAAVLGLYAGGFVLITLY